MTTLILLPGMDGTGELFAPFVAVLDKRITAVIIRYPVNEPLTYQQLLSRVRDILPADEPFFLLDESFSGPIALSITAEQPAGLRGVILCASFTRNPRPGLQRLRRFIGVLPLEIMPRWLLALPLFGRWSSRQLRALLSDALLKVSPDVLRARMQEVLAVDVTAAAKEIRVPMLYLRATKDSLVPGSAASLLHELQPAMRITTFKAPHMLLQVVPAEAAQAVASFMAQYHGPASKH
ncbi:alpha/beta fold hydrolase [Massilia niabensis]|uniref:Alpha/beta fold hydrolase n=1 Tax=Massilia niabensis TaxID=544910 RepID=A0ABW0L7U9_9BURK